MKRVMLKVMIKIIDSIVNEEIIIMAQMIKDCSICNIDKH